VRVLRGNYTRAEWDRFGTGGFEYPDGTKTEDGGGCSMFYGALHELTSNGLLERAGLPQPGTSGLVYYAILGGGTNGSCGAGGFLAASELELLELAEQNCPTGRLVNGATDCVPVGAIAHEIGHGFGLPHTSERPNCAGTPSLMVEWWLYDGVGLCDEERTDLLSSGYLYCTRRDSRLVAARHDARLLPARRGCAGRRCVGGARQRSRHPVPSML
jgi:hypothetical protein